jgi:hypothetical protein
MFAVSTSAFAWGEAGHLMSNEAATLTLPNDMPHFFYRTFPELIWLGYEPDRIKGTGVSLDAVNPPDHFLDYEFVAGLELPPDRYKFLALMETSGRRANLGITNSEAGFLPWRIAEMSELLTTLWRQWRATAHNSSEHHAVERQIIDTAGVLGHFVADASNPDHATINFNGWITANPNGYATDCGAHARFEREFISHAISVSDITPKVAAPVLRDTNYFATALAFVKSSNALTERLYQLDKQGAFNLFAKTARNPGGGKPPPRFLAVSAARNDSSPDHVCDTIALVRKSRRDEEVVGESIEVDERRLHRFVG